MKIVLPLDALKLSSKAVHTFLLLTRLPDDDHHLQKYFIQDAKSESRTCWRGSQYSSIRNPSFNRNRVTCHTSDRMITHPATMFGRVHKTFQNPKAIWNPINTLDFLYIN
ncbi:unnamed protein product [Schistosoma rodhaini]|uniref:Uncharacterized protein n=1 Tax=Schistosoma rodhaini TaxID=6188 RepID=A0AA85GGS8_9TREM|nr:unnamed protein product [Schistosoma rodhaini]